MAKRKPKPKPAQQDRILTGWKEIASITPWADHNTQTAITGHDRQWLRNNGYVIRSVIRMKTVIWTWESLLKAGMIELMRIKEQIRAQRPKRKWKPVNPHSHRYNDNKGNHGPKQAKAVHDAALHGLPEDITSC